MNNYSYVIYSKPHETRFVNTYIKCFYNISNFLRCLKFPDNDKAPAFRITAKHRRRFTVLTSDFFPNFFPHCAAKISYPPAPCTAFQLSLRVFPFHPADTPESSFCEFFTTSFDETTYLEFAAVGFFTGAFADGFFGFSAGVGVGVGTGTSPFML